METENQFRIREKYHKKPHNLFIRNILNAVFMLAAAVGMIGMWLFPEFTTYCYILCLIAVCIKMVEVMLRMPGMKK